MNRYLPKAVWLLCLLLGLFTGWYLGYTRPAAQQQREILRQYQLVKDNFRMTDQEIITLGELAPTLKERWKVQDEMAALTGLLVLKLVDAGKLEDAKRTLGQTISLYYHGHRNDGDTNLVYRIEGYAATNAAFSNMIYTRYE